MVKFTLLTEDRRAVWINPEHVTAVFGDEDSATIHVVGYHSLGIRVFESLDDVIEEIIMAEVKTK